MIRFLLVALTLFSFLILSIPMLIYYHFLGKKNPDKKNWQCLKIVQFMFRLILKISGVRCTVLGRENIPEDTAVLYIGNHRSYFDIILTYTHFPSITGMAADGPISPSPSTAVPSVITATRLPRLVRT